MKHAVLLLLLCVACGATDAAHTGEPLRTSDDGRTVTLEKDRARVHLEIGGEPDAAERAAIVTWAKDAVTAVSAFYGRPPVPELRVVVSMRPGSGVDDGVTRVEKGTPTIRINVGSSTDAAEFGRDWVLTHEMVHTAFPELTEEHHWLEEGLATYIEPIARARSGLESDAEVWKQLVEGLPKGQPRRNDRGLDRTHTWGRTYWGGALFCFLADVGIRERTSNKLGLRDALVSLVAEGRTILTSANIDDVLAHMDRAVGVPVLSELYAQHSNAGVQTDLGDLWKRLGVVYERGRVTFDDAAPQAALRRTITH